MDIIINSFDDESADEFYHSLVNIETKVYESVKEKYDSKPWGIAEFKYRLPDKERYSFIMKYRGESIGFSIGYAYRQNWFHISRVAILEEMQGRGLGKTLLNHQLNKMKLRMPDIISVDLKNANKDALNLYRKIGFNRVYNNELLKYLEIRQRNKEEYMGEDPSHIVMVISKQPLTNIL